MRDWTGATPTSSCLAKRCRLGPRGNNNTAASQCTEPGCSFLLLINISYCQSQACQHWQRTDTSYMRTYMRFTVAYVLKETPWCIPTIVGHKRGGNVLFSLLLFSHRLQRGIKCCIYVRESTQHLASWLNAERKLRRLFTTLGQLSIGSWADVPWHGAAERWLWNCWWVMSIWTSGWGRRGICGCCWAGSAGRLRSRCEQCPSAPSSETPVPKQDHTHTHTLHLSTWEMLG